MKGAMNQAELSVSELAGITGLKMDPAWQCAATEHATVWCTPGWQAAGLLNSAAAALPPASAVRVERRSGETHWETEWPLAWSLHWLRETTPGFPLGLRPVRVHPASGAPSAVRLRGSFVTVVWRGENGVTHAQVRSPREDTWDVAVEDATATGRSCSDLMDEALRGLTGATSIEWLRGVFADSCSPRWSELAERIGARPDQLDDLASCFHGLTTSEEDAFWRAAASTENLEKLRPWLNLLAAGERHSFEERVSEELKLHGPRFWGGAAGEWLSALAGGPLERLQSPEAARRLGESASKLAALLIRDDLATMLVRLRAVADGEWTDLARPYRHAIEECCGPLSETADAGNVAQEINLWLKKLHSRLCASAARAARQLVREQLASRSAESASAVAPAFAEFECDATPEGALAMGGLLRGDWQACFDGAGGARITGGRLCEVIGRRIGVGIRLPFLSRKTWALDRESLADAAVRESGRAWLTVPSPDADDARGDLEEEAATLLGAAFSSRAELPADDMIHMVHEERHALCGNEGDTMWLRLLGAYGLSMPQRPAGPCEATLRIEIPARWAEAWCQAPLKRDAERFAPLSLAMQEMTRHWLPALALASPACFETPNSVLPLLVYAATRPCVHGKGAEFDYGALSLGAVQRVASTALPRLPEILAPLCTSLRESGRTRAAEHYSPERARIVVSAVQRQPKALAALLANDAFLVEYCFQIAGMCRELRSLAGRNPAQALRRLTQFSGEIVRSYYKGMKKVRSDESFRGLGRIYLLEATRVLAGGSTANGFRAALSVRALPVAQSEDLAA